MNDLLQDTLKITRTAGAAIMQYYKSSFDVSDKAPDNPVTDADYAADTLLKEKLRALLPEAGWLSEETVDNPERLNNKQVWVVDPLDGTKEFIMGEPEFAISVALVEDGQPILGVIYNPPTDELFYATKGGGAFFNDKMVQVTERTKLQGSIINASRSERKRGEFEPFEENFQIRTMGGTAYKLARVAAGLCDAAWSRGPKNEWDICAGVLLVHEAGGRCVNLDDEEFNFNRPKTLVNGFIADNGHLHDDLIAALAPHRDTARKK
jgi:myo-inositol-1(or 4)-monophosphatase